MTAFEWLSAALVVGLVIYLFWALLFAEELS